MYVSIYLRLMLINLLLRSYRPQTEIIIHHFSTVIYVLHRMISYHDRHSFGLDACRFYLTSLLSLFNGF